MVRTVQRHHLVQFPLVVAMVAVQMSVQEAHPSLVRVQVETVVTALLQGYLAEMVRRIQLQELR
jgi:hypothetical protein